jgi:hypothetical protein
VVSLILKARLLPELGLVVDYLYQQQEQTLLALVVAQAALHLVQVLGTMVVLPIKVVLAAVRVLHGIP